MDDFSIMENLQNMHPWLVRVWIDDKEFAYTTQHLLITIPREDTIQVSNSFEDMLFMINKNKLHIPPNSTSLSPLAGYIFLWLRYVCITNRKLYRCIISCCFDEKTILDKDEYRRIYIDGRLRGLGIMGYELKDIYFILKAYLDVINAIGPHAYTIAYDYMEKPKDYLDIMHDKYPETEKIYFLKAPKDIAELIMRDFFEGKKVVELP